MLGVSEAATVGLHFQENYCGSAAYSGFPVTLTAFGIAPTGWENLTPMETGYSSCNPMQFYTLNEVIDSTTASDGLNPLPNGSLNLTWSANGANFSGFAGYAGSAPSYGYDGHPPSPMLSGEQEIYSTFLRDGVNFGVGSSCGDNTQPAYSVDITGLKTVFTNSPFVIELIAGSDSMQTLTNAFVIDATTGTTNSVIYPSTPPPYDEGGTCGQWLRGHGGGLSTVSVPLNTDHVQIISNHPQHGGTGAAPTGYNEAGTISGFIVTDKPVVTMSPQPVLAGPHDSVTLNPYAIGVPPLAYQWWHNGVALPGATNLVYVIPNLSASLAGNYQLQVTNKYGSALSSVAAVTEDAITMTSSNNFVADTNPTNALRTGIDYGATWQATNSDGTTTRSGVMQFVAASANEIDVAGTANFDAPLATVTFWMRSAGTDQTVPGNTGAALFGRSASKFGNDFILVQLDGGNVQFTAPGNNNNFANTFNSTANVSDNKWHFIALTYDQTINGSATLYIDGTLDSSNPNADVWAIPAGTPIQLGASTDVSWRAYNGAQDDVRFYSRQLTAGEIATIYSTGSLVDPANLQMRLNFDTAPGMGVALTWGLPNAILQSSSSVQGPYTDVTAAPSPYYVASKLGQRFYRYRFVGSSVVSNPYQM